MLKLLKNATMAAKSRKKTVARLTNWNRRKKKKVSRLGETRQEKHYKMYL